MRISQLRLSNFRNVAFAELDARGPRIFLLGANGQGKSNILEALGMVTACRSFRTQNLSVLPKQGTDGYVLFFNMEHEHEGASELEIQGGRSGRRVLLDGEKLPRLGDFIGRFPVVALSSGDLQLLRGGPAERRRFLDLTLSATNPAYYAALRDYHRGVAERNRLLKHGGGGSEFDAFELGIAARAETIRAARLRAAAHLAQGLAANYASMAEKDEGPFLELRPSSAASDPASFAEELRENRKRDAILGATQKGPHRDDFAIGLETGGARDYASDGQQRALCVALRLAQADFYREALSIAPVLLADDVLGELDPQREAGFWKTCPDDLQIIATGTEPPKNSTDWHILEVEGGALRPSTPGEADPARS
ncbi:MAG: DNA replication/repair protein RecF [Opitutales bacterium]